MWQFLRRLALASVIVAPVGAAHAQTAVNGIYLSGTAPTGFSQQPLLFHCTVPGNCPSSTAWPLVELYTNGALNSVTNPIWISPATGATFTVTLPTGASTSALQPAINGDGGALAHVTNFPATQPVSGTVTVNVGTTGGLALAANQPTNAAQGSTTSGQTGHLMLGAATTAAPTPATGTSAPISIDSANGAVRVENNVNGGPLGTQAIGNSQAVNPATASQWATIYGADATPVTGTISTNDLGSACTATSGGQVDCTGTPTTNSSISTATSGVGCISVSSSIAGGTATVQLSTEISQDNTNWYGRGLFLDSNGNPIWHNNIVGGVFAGQTPGAGIFFYRARATSFTVLTGSPVITVIIKQSQALCVPYVGNLPTAAVGSGSVAAVNVQGGGPTSLSMNVNTQQQAGVNLAAPTAPGVPATTGVVPTVNIGGGGNVFQANLFNQNSASTATVTQIFALSGTTTIYLISYFWETDPSATSAGTFQIVTGTPGCGTIHQTLTPVETFLPNGGHEAGGGIGVLGASSPGDAMCVVTTTTNLVKWRVGATQQ